MSSLPSGWVLPSEKVAVTRPVSLIEMSLSLDEARPSWVSEATSKPPVVWAVVVPKSRLIASGEEAPDGWTVSSAWAPVGAVSAPVVESKVS
jgi:hypothetical protein